MGELTASIAHEVNQPLTAVVNNANASISLLPKDTPGLEEVRQALTEIIEDADSGECRHRAGSAVGETGTR
jgi:signal transduction histidine kinase